jgi:hypothetical protein
LDVELQFTRFDAIRVVIAIVWDAMCLLNVTYVGRWSVIYLFTRFVAIRVVIARFLVWDAKCKYHNNLG